MLIYVQSAGTRKDYHWLSASPGAVLLGWHSLLAEGDKAFALVAGYFCGSWHIELRNLLLPGVTDEIANRQIVLNICFSELESEEEVRAIALAYLGSELKRKESGRPSARYIPKLAAAYKATAKGDYDYDTKIAIEWAKNAIAEGKKVLKSAPKSKHKLHCTINPNKEDEVKRLRVHIERTPLTQKEGVRLICSDIPIVTTLHADFILRFSDATTGTWKLVEPPEERPTPKDMPGKMPQGTRPSTFAQKGGELGALLDSKIAKTKWDRKLGSSETLEALGYRIGAILDYGVDKLKQQKTDKD